MYCFHFSGEWHRNNREAHELSLPNAPAK